jgi:predicted Zn-dependent peptidase
MSYKLFECNGYKLHTIKTNKFKNWNIEIMFRRKLEKENITKDNLLSRLLVFSSLEYPTKRDLAIELEDLYNSYVRGYISKVGNQEIISIVGDFLNPCYCEEGFLSDALSFIVGMINKPNIKNNSYDKRSFDIIKNQLKSNIESIKDNAARYGLSRCLTLMDDKCPSSYEILGTLEDLDKINEINIVDSYNSLFTDFECDIYICGNLDMEEVYHLLKDKFKFKKHSSINDIYLDPKVREKTLDVYESGKYEQDSLFVAYNVVDFTLREKLYVAPIFNTILGNNGLSSKLFKSIREENSLCYTVRSIYNRFDQNLIIYSGIDKKDKDKCIKLIDIAMNDMKNGKISDDELTSAKKISETLIKCSEDSLSGIIGERLYNNLANIPLNKERIEVLKTVTKEEIMDLAKKIKLNTIYLLGGEV